MVLSCTRLTEQSALESAFSQSQQHLSDGLVWVKTEIKAYMNPTRMSQIGVLAREIATSCPACHAPGWGLVKAENGLKSEYCHVEREMIAHEVFGCVLCEYTKKKERRDGLKTAPQMHCGWRNPSRSFFS